MSSSSTHIALRPIGIIHTPHTDPGDTPRQPTYARGVPGTVEIFPEYESGLDGIERCSYVHLIFAIDRAGEPRLSATPPGDTEPRGIFATRSPHHPNGIGLSLVKVTGREGRMLRVEDVDILDGTPLLDIKPYSSRIDVRDDDEGGLLANPLHLDLASATTRPDIWSRYTADTLWTDRHIATQMLGFHLNPDTDLASRNPEFIERSVRWIAGRFGVGERTRVLDLGCGPGLYTTRLAETGAAVTGVDFSENSLLHARAQAERSSLSIEYVHANYLEYEPNGEFDLITFIYWDLAALDPDQRAGLLATCRSALADGGAMLLDVPSAGHFASVVEAVALDHSPYAGFWSPKEHFVIKATHRYEPELVSLDKYTVIEPSRTREIYNWLQSFTPGSLERELAEAGLETAELLGDVAGESYDPSSDQFAVVVRRAL